MLLLELALVVIAVVLAIVKPKAGHRWFESVEHAALRLADRPWLAITTVGATALIVRLALLPLLSIPQPLVHDEFGYLLAADTFAHGRLTNAPHPMWMHFESFSILQQPTYQCYGPAMQGLILALGRVVLGHPFWGVWLSAGVMCAAICWMLQGWLPPVWALAGGFLAVLRLGTLSYWANSYWGGAAGAIGAALVLGALPRIKQRWRYRDAIVMAIGLAILANSRPFEGLVISLPVALCLLWWMLGKSRPAIPSLLRRVVLPISLLMAVTLAGMGYYFWHVTGSPFRMPYQVERETYGIAPYFLWQSPRPEPVYHHAVMQKMYEEDMVTFSHTGPLLMAAYSLTRIWMFFIGPVLTLPLVMAFFVLPYGLRWRQIDPRTRFLCCLSLFFWAALASELYFEPHYAAPLTCVVLALILTATRSLRRWRSEYGSGLFLNRAIAATCFATFLVRAFALPLHIPLSQSLTPAWFQKGPDDFGRGKVLSALQSLPGRQLVIVHYELDHPPFAEWVYNEANIDRSRIVWAQDMGASKNRELVEYFQDRHIWLLRADANPPTLSAYNETSAPISEPLRETKVVQ